MTGRGSGSAHPIALHHAVRHFWVSTGIEVDAAAMARAFRTGNVSDDLRAAVASHLGEAEPAELADLIVEGSASIPGLRRLAAVLLPVDHWNRVYIEGFR